MKLCNETVTVFNARVDPGTHTETFEPTVLKGVGWFGRAASAADGGGLKAENRFILRIPEEADSGGRTYAEPRDYREAADPGGLWTLQKGDAIVRAVCREPMPPARLRERFGANRVLTVLGVTDNRCAANGRHWRVEGA